MRDVSMRTTLPRPCRLTHDDLYQLIIDQYVLTGYLSARSNSKVFRILPGMLDIVEIRMETAGGGYPPYLVRTCIAERGRSARSRSAENAEVPSRFFEIRRLERCLLR